MNTVLRTTGTLLVLACFSALQVQAAHPTALSNITIIEPPEFLGNQDLASDTEVFGFFESIDLTLEDPLDVDATGAGTFSTAVGAPGTIPAGTRINSFMLHFDPLSIEAGDPGVIGIIASMETSSEILGVIFLNSSLNGTDAIVGSPTTDYSGNPSRGFEPPGTIVEDFVTVGLTGDGLRSLSVSFKTAGATDQVRVITASLASDTAVRDIPTPEGDNVPVIDIATFNQVAARVVAAGETSADFCVAPDPRELFIANGEGALEQGVGQANGSSNGDGGASVFIERDLYLAELAGTGTCTGDLEFEDDDYDTWEDIFADIDLLVAARYRGYVGEFTLPSDSTPTKAVWLVVGVVRSSALVDGPVTVAGFPSELIDYSNTLAAMTPGCDRALDWRNLNLGGTVEAFGEVPNVEGSTMIVEAAQCNLLLGLTRRTTHVFPVRLDGPAAASGKENENIRTQFDGIQGTLAEAAVCADAALIGDMQSSLDAARTAFSQRRYADAEESLEQIARLALNAPDAPPGAGFSSCPVETNYRGNFTSRALSAAFTVHDRFEHPDAFVKYFIPADLDVPLLDKEP